MAVCYRPMTANDVEMVSALAHEIWHRHYPGIITPAQIDYMLAQRYHPDRLRDELANASVHWELAEDDGGLVGFASTHHDVARRDMKLDKLYVHPGRQRQGVGRALILRAIARAAAMGCDTVILAVNKHNQQAIAAYRKYGFEVRDSVAVDIGGGFVMDDFIMARSVRIPGDTRTP